MGPEAQLAVLLKGCRSRGFGFLEQAYRLYFPNKLLLAFVDILKVTPNPRVCHSPDIDLRNFSRRRT